MAGVTDSLPGVMSNPRKNKTATDTGEITGKLASITNTLSGVTTNQVNNNVSNLTGNTDKLAGVTASLSGVTIASKSSNQITMSSKGVNTEDGENSMLLAIAQLESKLLGNCEKDLTDVEECLMANMETIVVVQSRRH